MKSTSKIKTKSEKQFLSPLKIIFTSLIRTKLNHLEGNNYQDDM